MIESSNIIPIVAIAGAFVTGIACTALHYGYLAWRTMHEVGLKRDMVARGYSAQEIVAVLSASGIERDDSELDSNIPPAKPIKQPAYGP